MRIRQRSAAQKRSCKEIKSRSLKAFVKLTCPQTTWLQTHRAPFKPSTGLIDKQLKKKKKKLEMKSSLPIHFLKSNNIPDYSF